MKVRGGGGGEPHSKGPILGAVLYRSTYLNINEFTFCYPNSQLSLQKNKHFILKSIVSKINTYRKWRTLCNTVYRTLDTFA